MVRAGRPWRMRCLWAGGYPRRGACAVWAIDSRLGTRPPIRAVSYLTIDIARGMEYTGRTMNEHLDKQLCATYPEIFHDRHAPMNQTAMCWGFACGDGWYALIDELCRQLMWPVTQARERVIHAERVMQSSEMVTMSDDAVSAWAKAYYTPEKLEQYRAELAELEAEIPVAVQVKEKFGGLRFYVRGGTTEHHTMIQFAEALSTRICEECGTTNTAKTYREGWHRTLCDTCAVKVGTIGVNDIT